MIIVGNDTNDSAVPLAFAFVEGEKTDHSVRFMASIRLKVIERPMLCVILDQHSGILVAMTCKYLG